MENNNEAEFDNFSEYYGDIVENDLDQFNINIEAGMKSKIFHFKNLIKKEPKAILDFGCGIGLFIPYLHEQFKYAKLYGCDISKKSIEIASEKYPYCDFKVINNIDDLKYFNKIDCIFISTVLHHIPQNEHEYWVKGLLDILEKGKIVVFENNMKNPLMKAFIKKTKIDKKAVMLSPKYCKRLFLNKFYKTKLGDKEILLKKDSIKLKYTYFFPWKNKIFRYLETLLFWLPLGAHYCVYIKK